MSTMGLPILLNIASLHWIGVQVVKKWTLGMFAFFGNHCLGLLFCQQQSCVDASYWQWGCVVGGLSPGCTWNVQLEIWQHALSYHPRILSLCENWICRSDRWSIKVFNSLSHPSILGVTLCFCTGLYAAAADSCSRDNFWTTFWISFILAQLLALTCRLPD